MFQIVIFLLTFLQVLTFVMKGIQGVSKIKDGYNPATWMLEVTTSSKERELGIDFAEVYQNSELYRYFHLYEIKSNYRTRK